MLLPSAHRRERPGRHGSVPSPGWQASQAVCECALPCHATRGMRVVSPSQAVRPCRLLPRSVCATGIRCRVVPSEPATRSRFQLAAQHPCGVPPSSLRVYRAPCGRCEADARPRTRHSSARAPPPLDRHQFPHVRRVTGPRTEVAPARLGVRTRHQRGEGTTRLRVRLSPLHTLQALDSAHPRPVPNWAGSMQRVAQSWSEGAIRPRGALGELTDHGSETVPRRETG